MAGLIDRYDTEKAGTIRMSDNVLTLGPIQFRDFEVPPRITFGGRQRTVDHFLASGARATDIMGPIDLDIIFSGALTGPSAGDRCRELDSLRQRGLILPLSWSGYAYLVIIKEFRVNFTNDWWIPYQLVCKVMDNAENTGADLLSNLRAQASSALAFLGAAGPSIPSLTGMQFSLPDAVRALSLARLQALKLLNDIEMETTARLSLEKDEHPASAQFATVLQRAEGMQRRRLVADCVGEALVCLESAQ